MTTVQSTQWEGGTVCCWTAQRPTSNQSGALFSAAAASPCRPHTLPCSIRSSVSVSCAAMKQRRLSFFLRLFYGIYGNFCILVFFLNLAVLFPGKQE